MVQWIVPPVGLIEPALAPEFFIDTVGAIELIGMCVRVYYCTDQMPLEAAGHTAQRVVTCKIVRPLASIPSAIVRLAQCLNMEEAAGIISPPPIGSKPRIVRL